MVLREIELMKVLDHPNIVRFHEVYEEKTRFYLVMELLSGRDLFERLSENMKIEESEAKIYMWQMLLAVRYLHGHNIAHLDLKPENFMFVSPNSLHLKVIDFGLAMSFEDNVPMTTAVGTPYYIAPEVINESYGCKSDMWSLGVTLYFMITGELPIYSDNEEEVFNMVLDGDYDMELFKDQNVSSDCVDFLTRLL